MSTVYAPRRGRPPIPRLFAPGSSVSERTLALVIALGLVAGGVVAREASLTRFLVGVLGGLAFFLISTTGRLTALRLIVVWLVFLGLIRRILIPFAGWSDQDPLLLVGPACAVMIWLASRDDSPKRLDALTLISFFFLIWSVGQIFNPAQGSIVDGAIGAIFWIPPLLWFFVGRSTPLLHHMKIVNLWIWLAIPVALHGLRQTYFGLFPFEYTWLGVSDFGESIFYEGFKIRSFGPLVSPQEYGAFLSLALTFLWGTILAGHRHRLLRTGLFLFLAWALLLQGTRSLFALFLAMLAITTLVWLRNIGAKLVMIGLLMASLVALAKAEAPASYGSGAGSPIIRHQVTGLLDPESTTGPIHKRLILEGFAVAWENPLGLGTSPATILPLKRGETTTKSTENDLSTIFVSLGIPAGVAYMMFLILLFTAAARRYRIYRSGYSIAVIGMLIAFFGYTWAGGMYAVSSFVWFTIGGLTRPSDEELAEVQEEKREDQDASAAA